MLRQILGMAAMRRMGPMGKAMIAAQLGTLAYGMYKQRKARRTGMGTQPMSGPGTGLDNSFGGDIAPTGTTPRRRGPFNPFA